MGTNIWKRMLRELPEKLAAADGAMVEVERVARERDEAAALAAMVSVELARQDLASLLADFKREVKRTGIEPAKRALSKTEIAYVANVAERVQAWIQAAEGRSKEAARVLRAGPAAGSAERTS